MPSQRFHRMCTIWRLGYNMGKRNVNRSLNGGQHDCNTAGTVGQMFIDDGDCSIRLSPCLTPYNIKNDTVKSMI